MKKLLALVLTLVFSLSAVSAGAQIPGQLKKTPLNYSGDMSFSITLDNADEIIAFIDSVGGLDSMDDSFIDIKNIIKSIFNINSEIFVKLDMSGDFKKIKAVIGGDYGVNVNLNENLDILVTPRLALWLDMDFTDTQNPVLSIIAKTPASSKYIVIDVFEILDEEQKKTVVDTLNAVFDIASLNLLNEMAFEIMEKYAQIEVSDNKCTVKLDSEGYSAMLTEMYKYMETFLGADFFAAASEMPIDLESVYSVPFLGEDGIVTEYTFDKDNISEGTIKADIDLNISEFYPEVTGEEWEFEDELNIRMTVNADCKMYDYGTTEIEFPVITEDNSLNFKDLIATGIYEDTYPKMYIGCETDDVIISDGAIYLPLRHTLEEVYGDTVTFAYDNGTLTAVCEHFNGFTTLVLSEGSPKAYADGAEYDFGGFFTEGGTAYADISLFNNVLGWNIYSINKNMITGVYNYYGSTYIYEPEEYVPTYPNWYAGGPTSDIPVIDGQTYVPLRQTLESAYEDTVVLEYNDGVITASCPYFPGFMALKLTVGSDLIYADTTEYKVGPVFVQNGITYVHPALFTDLFGWELSYIEYDVLASSYDYEYYTETW